MRDRIGIYEVVLIKINYAARAIELSKLEMGSVRYHCFHWFPSRCARAKRMNFFRVFRITFLVDSTLFLALALVHESSYELN